jgi:hypothetical protein
MFDSNINEFKNVKILGRLRECRKVYEEMKFTNFEGDIPIDPLKSNIIL